MGMDIDPGVRKEIYQQEVYALAESMRPELSDWYLDFVGAAAGPMLGLPMMIGKDEIIKGAGKVFKGAVKAEGKTVDDFLKYLKAGKKKPKTLVAFPEKLPKGMRYIQKEVPNLPKNVPSGFKPGKKMTSPMSGESYSHLRILGSQFERGYYQLQGLTKKGNWETYSVRMRRKPGLELVE